MTQCEMILDYLKLRGSITPDEALKYLAVGRLAARVSDLRNKGVNIITVNVKGKNRFGKKVNYARYELGK